MLNSLLYIAACLGCLVVYWSSDPKWREKFLALSMVMFVFAIAWQSGVALVGFTLLTWYATHRPGGKNRKLALVACLAVGGYLAAFKYIPPALYQLTKREDFASIAVPLGASYFTFKIIHYVIESYRGHLPEHDFAQFVSYLFFGPMFMAGPIERFDDFLKHRDAKLTWPIVYAAGTRICFGVIKKYIIIGAILDRKDLHTELWEGIPLIMPSYTTEALLTELPKLRTLWVWQYVINGFIGNYVDFSAYCDIAIGVGMLFGIRLTENFNWPFLVTNIGDFWKRYHISLSNWAQRYVYFPVLGETRNAQLALYATMVTIGVWHAGNANYLAWGFYQATMLSLHLMWSRWLRRRLAQQEEDYWLAQVVESTPWNAAGWLVTTLGICGSFALSSTVNYGIWPGIRILGALVGVKLKG